MSTPTGKVVVAALASMALGALAIIASATHVPWLILNETGRTTLQMMGGQAIAWGLGLLGIGRALGSMGQDLRDNTNVTVKAAADAEEAREAAKFAAGVVAATAGSPPESVDQVRRTLYEASAAPCDPLPASTDPTEDR